MHSKALLYERDSKRKQLGEKMLKSQVCISLPFQKLVASEALKCSCALCKLHHFLPVFGKCLNLLRALHELQDVDVYFRVPDPMPLSVSRSTGSSLKV